MPYTVGYAPAPLTFAIRPKIDWRTLLVLLWFCYTGYHALEIFRTARRIDHPPDILGLVIFAAATVVAVLSLLRRERIEFYADRVVWRRTYLGVSGSRQAPLAEVVAAQWSEGDDRGRRGKGPDYVEFFLSTGSVQACFGLSFEEWERMREDIRQMYPNLVKRWGAASIHSKDLTLLNLN